MSITKEQIVDTVATLSIMEVVELITLMEEKFGVSAAVPVAVGTAESQTVEEQTEFNVILTAIGNNKVPVIKVVRNELGLGLQEAKTLVESVPATLKEGITKEQAEALKKSIEEVGATVEIK